MKHFLIKVLLSLGIFGIVTQSIYAQIQTNSHHQSKTSINAVILPYATNALSPVISQQTIELHYGKHLQGYITNLKKLIEGTKFEGKDLESIVRESDGAIFNNAGQVLNHNLYFLQFQPKPEQTQPQGQLAESIKRHWGSFEAFQQAFEEAGAKLFGSGWLWLSTDEYGMLEISLHSGGDNPITKNRIPILGVDLWEHAYYLDYQNRRTEHLKALWNIINWRRIEHLYSRLLKSKTK